ncbi:hypothetical protein Tco_0036453 [Tanacetum coccineum]
MSIIHQSLRSGIYTKQTYSMASNEETKCCRSDTSHSMLNGPTPHPMITDPPTTDSAAVPAPREKLDSEFSEEENKLEMADTQAEIILSQGLPRHIFNNLNQTSTAKEIWDNVEMLMQGSGRTIQQRMEGSCLMSMNAFVAFVETNQFMTTLCISTSL